MWQHCQNPLTPLLKSWTHECMPSIYNELKRTYFEGEGYCTIALFWKFKKWFNIYYFGMLNGAQHYSAVHTCGYLYCVDVECKKYLSRLITLRRYIIPYIERMWELFLYSIDYNSQNTYHSFYVVTVLWNIKISTILKSPDVCLFL